MNSAFAHTRANHFFSKEKWCWTTVLKLVLHIAQNTELVKYLITFGILSKRRATFKYKKPYTAV